MMAMVHLERVIVVRQEHRIKRCLKLLFLHQQRQAICTNWGDLCKQEAPFYGRAGFYQRTTGKV